MFVINMHFHVVLKFVTKIGRLDVTYRKIKMDFYTATCFGLVLSQDSYVSHTAIMSELGILT
jgi:hypothetical protein